MQPQRIALIGCGFFAPNHLQAWLELPEAELVAVCDRDPERAATAAKLARASAYTDAARMLDEVSIDAVDIVTGATSHKMLAQLCIERRVAAIIQKPLAPTLRDAVAIANLAASAYVTIMVHENFRFQQPIRAVKSILDSGAIGTVRYGSVRFRCGHDVYTGQPYMRSDERLVLMDVGVHVFDVARFLLGEILDVSCRTQHVRDDVRGEDMASALVSFDSGAMGLIEASYGSFLAEDPFPETLIAVEGTRGSVVLDRHYRIKLRSNGRVQDYSVEPAGPGWGQRPWHVVQQSVVDTCRHWLTSRAAGAEPETVVADNVKTLSVIDACYASASRGGALVRPDERLREAYEGLKSC